MLAALRAQGAAIDGEAFPLVIGASGLSGGEVQVDASVSSQFLSGLLMAAPFARANTRLCFETLVSRPYLDLTLNAMRAFGVEAEVEADAISVARGGYRAAEFPVEPDVSTASYFLASAALTGTTVRLPGLDRRRTAQGDIELVELLERMGCTVRDGEALELTGPAQLHGIEADMGNSTDVFMTLACVAVFADGPTTISGIGHARVEGIGPHRRVRREPQAPGDRGRRGPGLPARPSRRTAGDLAAHLRGPPHRDGLLADRDPRRGDARGPGRGQQDLPGVLRVVAGDRRHGDHGGELMVIAIDGPAGAGKSTVARAVADALGFTYLDTGAMYRCVALASLRRDAPPAEVASRIEISLGERVLLDGEDVTDAIRTPEVSERASQVAAEPLVRRAMVAQQQRIMAEGDWVADGRDIGTVVAP